MEDDASLTAVLQRFDSLAEVEAPSTDFLSRIEVERVRTPLDNFREWVLRGGGLLALFLSALVLVTSNFEQLGESFLVVPVVISCVGPLLGSHPIRHPKRLVAVGLLGAGLTVLGTSLTQLAVRTLKNESRPDLIYLAEILQRNIEAATQPLSFVFLSLLLAVSIWGTLRSAQAQPWFERRSRNKPWRGYLAVALVGVPLLLGLKTAASVTWQHDAPWLRAALADPELERFTAGRRLADTGSGLDLEALQKAGLPNSLEERQEFLINGAPEELRRVAQALVTQFESQADRLTLLDLELAYRILDKAADKRFSSPELASLLELLTQLSQRYALNSWQLCQSNLRGYLRKVIIGKALAEAELTTEELEKWQRQHPEARPLSLEELRRTQDLIMVDYLAMSPKRDVSRQFYPLRLPTQTKPLEILGIPVCRSLPELAWELERGYFLACYERYRQTNARLKRWHAPDFGDLNWSLFYNPGTEARQYALIRCLVNRAETVEVPSRGRQPDLLGAILEAKLSKAKNGSYPSELKTYFTEAYQSDGKTAIFYTKGERPGTNYYYEWRLR